MNNGFLKENQLLNNASKLKDIPGYIIQGRYDMICPMKQAWDLHGAWGASELIIVQGAAHSPGEKAVSAALVKAGNDMHKLVKSMK
jgi:proline iminopeptidase